MTRPVLLDLYCGAGGAAVGYHRAGFDVVGVDLVRQPRYPFQFELGNADTFPLDGFDAIHASPPCKLFTALAALQRPTLFPPHTDHLTPTMARLADVEVPWVVENVPGAAAIMPGAVTYCGSSFGLAVRRHRLFASNVALVPPPCDHAAQGQPMGVYGHGGGWRRTGRGGGGWKVSGQTAADALGVDWTSYQPALSQMIPPAYTEHIGAQLIEHARTRARSARIVEGMPTTATDLRYGRRGGGWLPPGYRPPTSEVEHCPVCDRPLTCGQSVHAECSPPILTLFGDDE